LAADFDEPAIYRRDIAMQQGVEGAGPCARNATTAQERDQRIGLVGR